MDDYAWYNQDSEEDPQTHLVGLKNPNPFGLYDIVGNVKEWCLDWYQGSYENLACQDPVGPSEGSERVLRGGDYYNPAKNCRSASRSHQSPTFAWGSIGFRVVVLPGS